VLGHGYLLLAWVPCELRRLSGRKLIGPAGA
jgi:hypothetical protein